MRAVGSSYSEYSQPESEFLIENIKGVFVGSEDYQYPELEDRIMNCIRFQFSEGTPEEDVLKSRIRAVILSWIHKRSLN